MAPSNVSVSNSTTSTQQLNFTDNSTNEDKFSIEIKGTSGIFTNLGTISALNGYGSYYLTVSGLSANTTYCYRFQAFNAAGNSPYSNEACGKTTLGSRSEVIVDDKSSDFSRGGIYWWEASAGYSSHMYYTFVNGNTVGSFGEWYPTLAGGNYEVYVYILSVNATTANAKYEITPGSGTIVKAVNQNIYYNAWVSLGTYNFPSGRAKRVRLTDATGETNYSLKVGFDAVRFTPR